MPAPAWIDKKIRNLINASSGTLSYSEAAAEIGRHGANKRHHKNGHTYRSPKQRTPVVTSVKPQDWVEKRVITEKQLTLSLQIPTRYF